MIAFQRSIVFVNEPDLNHQHIAHISESIRVIEQDQLPLLKRQSEWVDISGQQGRYWSNTPFERGTACFSWALEIKNVVVLHWDCEQRCILYQKREAYHPDRLNFWVLHTFLPLVLELERTYRILHVGAVEVGGSPILFSAPSFGGKSTMVDYFLKRGHSLLSDDSLGIDKREEGYYAIPSYPFHRPFREPETLGNYTEHFVTEPKPIRAVYLLDKSSPQSDIKITAVKGIEKFKAFHYSTFIDFGFMKKERFDFFTEMAASIPAYRITVPWDMERLEEVYEKIIAHINGETT